MFWTLPWESNIIFRARKGSHHLARTMGTEAITTEYWWFLGWRALSNVLFVFHLPSLGEFSLLMQESSGQQMLYAQISGRSCQVLAGEKRVPVQFVARLVIWEMACILEPGPWSASTATWIIYNNKTELFTDSLSWNHNKTTIKQCNNKTANLLALEETY